VAWVNLLKWYTSTISSMHIFLFQILNYFCAYVPCDEFMVCHFYILCTRNGLAWAAQYYQTFLVLFSVYPHHFFPCIGVGWIQNCSCNRTRLDSQSKVLNFNVFNLCSYTWICKFELYVGIHESHIFPFVCQRDEFFMTWGFSLQLSCAGRKADIDSVTGKLRLLWSHLGDGQFSVLLISLYCFAVLPTYLIINWTSQDSW
jgi:hypothetical protein